MELTFQMRLQGCMGMKYLTGEAEKENITLDTWKSKCKGAKDRNEHEMVIEKKVSQEDCIMESVEMYETRAWTWEYKEDEQKPDPVGTCKPC